MNHTVSLPALALLVLLIAPGWPGRTAGPGSERVPSAAVKAHARNVVLIIMDERDYARVIGNAKAPYLNSLLPVAALMTNSHAVAHPSQPNYLALFSGSTQGVTDDSCPHRFSSTNLGAEAIAAGWTFTGFSESMPRDGFRRCSSRDYTRAHNPWVDFTTVPATSNVVWFDIPAAPPVIANDLDVIVPNTCNDMQHCSTLDGDNWLRANLSQILLQQDGTKGLTIVTWDEAAPDADGQNHIPTVLLGPMIVPGQYSQRVDHYSLLHTIEEALGVPCLTNACGAPPLRGMWR